jgi:hypothetical protein
VGEGCKGAAHQLSNHGVGLNNVPTCTSEWFMLVSTEDGAVWHAGLVSLGPYSVPTLHNNCIAGAYGTARHK